MLHENGTHVNAEERFLSPLDGSKKPDQRAHSAAEIRAMVQSARVAQPEWAGRSTDERAAVLTRAAKAMLRDKDTVLALTKEEMGKHEVEGIFTEGLGHLDAVGSWKKIVARAMVEEVRLSPLSFPKKRARIELVPRGVVGVIAPWNFPVAGLYRSVIPALLLGNAVVLKPSEHTPRTSAWFLEHLAQELPFGIAQVAHGDGKAGAALIDAGIDACTFTGSVHAGAKVREHCAARGIPSSIEMGGKDAAIVLRDCEMWRTVAGITHWALSNAGQSCGALEIVYVDETIADRFVSELASAWERLRTGPGDEDVEVAPMATRTQLEIVEAHVADALKRGAKLVTGGKRTGKGLGYLPTILDKCTSAMDVVTHETFGPVLAIVRIRGVDEAVRAINEGRYGLGASVWSKDIARAERIASRLEVGIASVNNHAFTGAVPALPWTGTRATGFGVANSHHSLTTFARPKAIVVDESTGPEIFWMPFDKTLGELGALLTDAQAGRVLGAWKIPLLLRKRMQRVREFFGG